MNQNPDVQPPEIEPTRPTKPPIQPGVAHAPLPVGQVVVRRMPAPPPLWQRLVLLVIRPEQWAEAARYPLRFTVIPLVLVCMLAATAAAVSTVSSATAMLNDIAQSYDQRFPALIYKNGKLSVDPKTANDANGNPRPLPRYENEMEIVLVDLSNKYKLDDFSQTGVSIIGTDTVRQKWWKINRDTPLPEFRSIPADPVTGRIDSASIKAYFHGPAAYYLLLPGVVAFFVTLALALIGSFGFAFAVMPLVAMGAPKLVMPRAVAYRMALAAMVPLVFFGGILQATGLLSSSLIPMDVLPFFCFSAAAGVAFWTGHLANGMFSMKRTGRAS